MLEQFVTISCVQSVEELHLPDQSPVLNVILSSEVNDHRRPKLVDSLEKKQVEILFYFLKQERFSSSNSLMKCIVGQKSNL